MPDKPASSEAERQLSTIRDFLRWALSEFRASKVVHGHGTTSATDEAAFLILEALHLPVDDINPWLDARLLETEKQNLASLIRARIETRKPAAYLVKRAYIHGIPFYIDERVIVPRSYIGELMFSGIFGGDEAPVIEDTSNVTSVLDLCTGSGCLAILMAHAFPNAEVDAIDISPDALAVARRNIADYALEDHLTPGGGLLCEIGTGRERLVDEFPQLDFLWLDTEESEGEVFWITREQLLDAAL